MQTCGITQRLSGLCCNFQLSTHHGGSAKANVGGSERNSMGALGWCRSGRRQEVPLLRWRHVFMRFLFLIFSFVICVCVCVFHFSGLSSLKALPLRQPFSAWWISLCSNTCASWMNCEIAACPESRTFRHRSYVAALLLLPKSTWDTWKYDPQYIYLRVFEHKIWNDSTIDNTFNRWWRGRPRHISIFHVFHARFCVRNVEMLWCSKSRWPSSKVPFTPFTPFELTSFWGPWVERRVGEIRYSMCPYSMYFSVFVSL